MEAELSVITFCFRAYVLKDEEKQKSHSDSVWLFPEDSPYLICLSASLSKSDLVLLVGFVTEVTLLNFLCLSLLT
jgi:hypothetical protein